MKINKCKKCPYLYNDEYCICHEMYAEDDKCDFCWEGLKEEDIDSIKFKNIFIEGE